jgi:hypothetical protein
VREEKEELAQNLPAGRQDAKIPLWRAGKRRYYLPLRLGDFAREKNPHNYTG